MRRRLSPAEQEVLRRTEPVRYRGHLLTPSLDGRTWYVTSYTIDAVGIPRSTSVGMAPTRAAAEHLVDTKLAGQAAN